MCQSQNEREIYLTYAKLNVHKKRVDTAVNIAKDALKNAKKPILSFSGGKDSIVMLDICVKAGFRGELLFFKYGICTDKATPTETIELVNYYAKTHGLNLNILTCLSEFDCWDELGYFCIFPKTKEEKRIFNKTNYDFRKQSALFEKEYGHDVNFIGMRKAESKTRKITLLKKGHTYQTKSRDSITCCPIADFDGKDVWAYIFANNLAYPSYYDYIYESRERIRNEPILLYLDSVVRKGHAQKFKAIFPEFIEEIKKRYPDEVL